MDDRDPGVEVRPEPVDEREGERDLGHEDERRPAASQGGAQELDVDRGLAAAGHAIEEERRGPRRPPSRARRPRRPPTCSGLSSLPAGRLRACPPARAASGCRGASRTSISTRPRRTSPASADGAVPPRELRRGHLAARRPGRRPQVREERLLPRPESRRVRPRRRRGGTGEADMADPARAGAGRQERPVQVDEAAGLEGSKAPQQRRPALGRIERPDLPGAGREGLQDRRVLGREVARADRRGAGRRVGVGGPPLGDELEPLEHARREHRPERERGRGEVVVGDPAREPHRRAPAAAGRRRESGRRSASPRRPARVRPARARSPAPAAARTRRARPRPAARSASDSGTRYEYGRMPAAPAASTATATSRAAVIDLDAGASVGMGGLLGA